MAGTASDFAVSLSQDEIPFKLRCASCNNLVVNAFRLPCCDQNVCEHCQLSLSEPCPVCMHSPLSIDDCKPNKSLRLTVKAFLKSEEKKRNKEHSTAPAPELSQTTSVPAATPVLTDEIALLVPGFEALNDLEEPVAQTEEHHAVSELIDDTENAPSSPSSSIEITLEAPSYGESGRRSTGFSRNVEQAGPSFGHNSTKIGRDTTCGRTEIPSEPSKTPIIQDPQHMPSDMGFDFTGMNNFGGAPNNVDMGSMMVMQNAMNPAHWSGFSNMMGVPAMGMDFMSTSQGMFGSFNGQVMGMHGMNGLHMGTGFDGGFGGWGNQSTMGMNNGGSGNFGANAGYYPSSGYNQQSHQKHFNQMHQQQFPMNSYKQNPFQGPGHQRGYERDRGRQNGRPQPRKSPSQGLSEDEMVLTRRTEGIPELSATARTETNITEPETLETQQTDKPKLEETQCWELNGSNTKQAITKLDTGYPSSTGNALKLELESENHSFSTCGPGVENRLSKEEQLREIVDTVTHEAEGLTKLQRIPAIVSSESMASAASVNNSVDEMLLPQSTAPHGPVAQFPMSNSKDLYPHGKGPPQGLSCGMRGVHGRPRGREFGPFGAPIEDFPNARLEGLTSQLIAPKGQGVEGAPTGPKAMRDGQSNVGFRGQGRNPNTDRNGRQEHRSTIIKPTVWESSYVVNEMLGSGSPTDVYMRRLRQERNNSRSPVDSAEDVSERERCKKHKSHQPQGFQDDQNSETKHYSRGSTSDSTSRHRRRRDFNKGRLSRRERDHDRNKSRNASPSGLGPRSDVEESESSRHRPDRNLTRRHSHERTKERTSRRPHSDREGGDRNDYDRRKNHRQSKSTSTKKQRLEPQPLMQEFKIKDRSKRTELVLQRESIQDENPSIDPHTLEREVRDRERLVKEQQRRDTIAASANVGKRGRDVLAEDTNRRPSRRKLRHEQSSPRRDRAMSYQYDDGEESKESRALRVEAEREAARWG